MLRAVVLSYLMIQGAALLRECVFVSFGARRTRARAETMETRCLII